MQTLLSHRLLAIVTIVIALAAAWALLGSDPESEVRDAHATLAAALSKSADDTAATAVMSARTLESLFAPSATVSGDGGPFARTYTPDEIASTAVRVREAFRSVDLGFGELEISFPTRDEAVTRFSAELVGEGPIQYRGRP